jgi:hypothetical protein
MGQLALGIVGGVVGAFFGMPQLGFLAGSLIGGMLFPAKGQNQSGPRLDNLAVTSSTYGAPIFIVYGTARISGQIIWSKPIREKTTKTKNKGAKGGGGSAGTTTTYSYFWTGAVGLCEGVGTSLLQIFADSKIVYDRTGNSATTKAPSFKFRLYYGDEVQMPDPVIEDDVGAANAVPHRGMMYVVFDDIPLQDYGNRVPNFTFTVVVAPETTSQTGVHGILDLVGGPVSTPRSDLLVPDWAHQRLYKFRTDGIHMYNINTFKEIRQATAADVLNPDDTFSLSFGGEVCVDDDGFIYAALSGGNSRPIVKIDGNSLREVGRSGASSSSLAFGSEYIAPDNMFVVNAYTATALERYIVSCTFFGGVVQYIHARTFSFSGATTVDEAFAEGVPGETREGQAVAYLIGRATFGPEVATPFGIYKVEMPNTAYLSLNADGTNPNIVQTKLGTVAPSDVVSWWSVFSGFRGAFFDTHESRLYFIVLGGRFFTTQTPMLVRYNPATATVEWAKEIPVSFSGYFAVNFSKVDNAMVAFVGSTSGSTSSVAVFNLATGNVTTTTGWDFALTSGGAQTYDSSTGAIVAVGTTLGSSGESNCVIFTGRGGQSAVALGDVVSDLCNRAGLDVNADIDVSELVESVDGYIVNQQMTVRAAIEPLGMAYQFDGVESDDILKFLHRGRASSLTITQDDLAFITEQQGEVLKETRIQEIELPERVAVVYIDEDKDFQQNTQGDKRTRLPTPSMYSRNQVSSTFPIVMTAQQAKQLASKLLYTTWIERVSQEFHTGWRYLKMNPVDTVTVVLSDNTTYIARLTQIDVGADYVMQFHAVNEDATSYDSTVVAASGDGFPQQSPPGPTHTRTFIWDSPLLRDSDDTGGVVSRLYTAAGGYGQTGWPGDQIEHSADGTFYNDVARITVESSWGTCLSPLGDTSFPFNTDETNFVDVFMTTGESALESVTQLEMVNGANGAILIDEATGNLEVIQYRDVTQNADGTYRLTGLLRGRRGTEVFTATHVASETIILLDGAAVESFLLGLGELNHVRYYKGVPYGTIFEDAPLKTLTSTGRDLKPYAPVSQDASVSGSDILIDWERRTRVSGDIRDGSGTVPLAETTEAYEIDIYDAPGTTVLRTLTSSTTSVTYLAANITTDLGGIPATLTFAVYQMSEAVGRGFTKKVTVPVE